MFFSKYFRRNKGDTRGHDYPPNIALLWWGYRASTDDLRWWIPYIEVPDQSKYKWIVTWPLGFGLGHTCVFMYLIGLAVIAGFLNDGKVSFVGLQIVTWVTMFISVGVGTTINATDGEVLWIAKWSLLNGRPFTLREIQTILDGDGGFQSVKNIFVGSGRARVLSLYLLLTRAGSRVGLAFLASSYQIKLAIDRTSSKVAYASEVSWGYLCGGFGLLVGFQLLIAVLSIRFITNGSIIPPNTALGLSIALRPCLEPLGDSGSLADTTKILEALEEDDPKYSLRITTIQGASTARFVLVSEDQDVTLTAHRLRRLERKTSLWYASLNFLTNPLWLCLLALTMAVGTDRLLLNSNINGVKDIAQESSAAGLGTFNNKLGLSIMLQIYSLFLGAFAEALLHIVRWACVSSNKTKITFVESLLAGNNWWNLRSFRFFSPGARRGFASMLTSTFATRAMVTAVGWAALTNYYDVVIKNGEGGLVPERDKGYWNIAAISLLWASFGMVVVMWVVCAGSLAYKKLIPDGNSLPKAHAFRRLAAQLERTGSVDSEVRYGKVVSSTGEFATAISGNAEPFVAGTYI
ncbi:hypothetical protein TWF281_003700 [Arthrobotrys megalospora]